MRPNDALFILIFHSFAHLRVLASCPPIGGTFSVNLPQLFPENADWDSVHCKLWTSALYNASVLVYDPYSNSSEIISFDGITDNTDYHVDGIDYDERSGTMFVVASSSAAFATTPTGEFLANNLTGPDKLLQLDTSTRSLIYEADLAGVQAQVLAATGQNTNGFQDMAEDSYGNTYAIGTFGNTIARIDPSGNVSLYYQPDASVYNQSVYGFGGIFAWENNIIISDAVSQGLVVFDTTASGPAVPIYVKPENFPTSYTAFADGLYAPPKYCGRVALWSDDYVNKVGGIVVYGSSNGWQTARYLGLIPNNDTLVGNGTPTATVQIADSIFILEEYFQPVDPPVVKKTSFPFIDITAQVDSFVSNWYFT